LHAFDAKWPHRKCAIELSREGLEDEVVLCILCPPDHQAEVDQP
jgi:hypothetical protein